MKYFIDTNIIIYSLKNSYPAIKSHFMTVPAQEIVIPEIVLAEIEYGARKSVDYNLTIGRYRAFTDVFDKAAFDGSAACFYGQIRAELEKSGQPIGPNDMLIASIVMANDGILVTHNVGEFSRIQNLKLEDWTL